MRNAVTSFLWAIPFEFACAAVVIIQSAAFGSYPQIAVSILNGASYNRIAQPFLLVGRVGITGVDFIFRIEVVDTAEIGSQPKCTLVIFTIHQMEEWVSPSACVSLAVWFWNNPVIYCIGLIR